VELPKPRAQPGSTSLERSANVTDQLAKGFTWSGWFNFAGFPHADAAATQLADGKQQAAWTPLGLFSFQSDKGIGFSTSLASPCALLLNGSLTLELDSPVPVRQWVHLAVSLGAERGGKHVSVGAFVNGRAAGSMAGQSGGLAHGLAQLRRARTLRFTVGGDYELKLKQLFLFSERMGEGAVYALFALGLDVAPSFHLLHQGTVAVFPCAPSGVSHPGLSALQAGQKIQRGGRVTTHKLLHAKVVLMQTPPYVRVPDPERRTGADDQTLVFTGPWVLDRAADRKLQGAQEEACGRGMLTPMLHGASVEEAGDAHAWRHALNACGGLLYLMRLVSPLTDAQNPIAGYGNTHSIRLCCTGSAFTDSESVPSVLRLVCALVTTSSDYLRQLLELGAMTLRVLLLDRVPVECRTEELVRAVLQLLRVRREHE
jgi:hypothetical protein